MKKMNKILTTVLVIALAALTLAGCAKKDASPVTTDGSTSMEKVIGTLGEAFKEKEGIDVTYNPTGSGSGIQAVSEGRCDIGLSSRALKDDEKATLTETTVALDGIAMIVNPENPVSDLTVEQIADIYTGKITNCPRLAAMTQLSFSSAVKLVPAPVTALNPSRAPRMPASTVRS